MDINRRDFFKLAGAAAVAAVGNMSLNVGHAQAPVIGSTPVKKGTGSSAKVYYSKKIDAAHLLKLYGMINDEIYGKVAIKLHTGEPDGPNILPRDLVMPLKEELMERMSDSAQATCNYFGKRIVFINVFDS